MSYLFVNVERFYERNFVWLVFGCDAFSWKIKTLKRGCTLTSINNYTGQSAKQRTNVGFNTNSLFLH
jgi:hypothetical protein